MRGKRQQAVPMAARTRGPTMTTRIGDHQVAIARGCLQAPGRQRRTSGISRDDDGKSRSSGPMSSLHICSCTVASAFRASDRRMSTGVQRPCISDPHQDDTREPRQAKVAVRHAPGSNFTGVPSTDIGSGTGSTYGGGR